LVKYLKVNKDFVISYELIQGDILVGENKTDYHVDQFSKAIRARAIITINILIN
tara:strand:+ start:1414 stop:1575 length:162 start_codon:yes stop_codon:yes gene_type:complete